MGIYDVMKRFLEAYGKDMEFCQIQLNYLDWELPGRQERRWSCSTSGTFPCG